MLENLVQAVTGSGHLAWGAAISLAGLAGLAWLVRQSRSPRSASRRMRASLRRSGLPHVRDVVIPDEVGGYTQADHLLLTPNGIVLLEWQHFDGVVHGSVHALNWTRFEGGRRHDFSNPFRRLKALAATLETLAPGAPVQVRLVVSGPVRFAKGIPDGVLTMASLREYLAAQTDPIPPAPLERWHSLLSRVACDPVAPSGCRTRVRTPVAASLSE